MQQAAFRNCRDWLEACFCNNQARNNREPRRIRTLLSDSAGSRL